MEYRPRHRQPFTLEQLIKLETLVITTEISRLQNALAHLRDTQRQLQENVNSEQQPDPEILLALKENDQVISSQEERISMLRLALEHKGLVRQANSHYDLPESSSHLQAAEGDTLVEDSNTAVNSTSEGVFL